MASVADTRERLPDFNRQEYEPIKQRALVNIIERRLNAINDFLLNLSLQLPEGSFAPLVHDHRVEDILDIATFYVSKADLAELKWNDLVDVTATNTPGTYAVNFNGSVYTLVELPAGGAGTFLDLSDTPGTFSGQALRLVRVNSGATALEYVDAATLGQWTNVTAGLTMVNGVRYLAVLAATANFPLPTTITAGQVFAVRNSIDSTADVLARVVVGASRQIAGLPVAEDLTCVPGETIILVARSTTLLDLVTPGAVGPYGADGLSATDQIESAAAAQFWLADTLPFKSLGYSGGFLSTIQIYMDSGLTDHRYTKTFNYTGGQLTSITLTRISDSLEWIKTLTYDIDNALELIGTEAA